MIKKEKMNYKINQTSTLATSESNEDLFTFTVDFILPPAEKNSSYPIYLEDSGTLIGFFSYKELNSARCVVDSKVKPLSLFLSSGQELFFTMMSDKANKNNFCGVLSEAPIDISSIRITF